jgi:hypothetical protein
MSYGRYIVKKTDSYGKIVDEVLTSGELVGFISVHNKPCAIILQDDGSLYTVETEKVRKEDGRVGHTDTGSAADNDGGDGSIDSRTARGKSKVRRT